MTGPFDPPGEHPPPEQVIGEIRDCIRALLKDRVIGIYLTGSLVHGDYDPGVSDIDLTAVLVSDLTPAEFEALRRLHDDLAARFPDWDDRIEVCYVPVDALQHIQSDERLIANISPGEPFHWTRLRPAWLINWYDLREQGRVIAGPEPATLLPTITRDAFVNCLVEHARSWNIWIDEMTRRQQQAYAILSMCRALYGVRHGQQVSKREAAFWVADQHPKWSGLVHRALQWRLTPEGPETDHARTMAETRQFIADLRAAIIDR